MSENAVALQVLIRCRPFAKRDKLGVLIVRGEESSEVELLSEDGSRFGRWGFTRAWWSAVGYEDYTDEASASLAREHGLDKWTSQEDVYSDVGAQMKTQFMEGNAVVMFAYGLSGSGKTYSVFGPDMVGMPEAWFNFAEPHRDWGVFPRLAYDIIHNEASNGVGKLKWSMSLKYFQNVVDRILDLLTGDGDGEEGASGVSGASGASGAGWATSPLPSPRSPAHTPRTPHKSMGGRRSSDLKLGQVEGVEDRHINEGFHVDSHGFVDITWCRRRTIDTWTELTETFKRANGRKAIAPTQFNNASTRGHCILVFEAKMPHPTHAGVTRIGRLYVCDLAGAEPAAEVHCAQYSRKVDADGHVHYEYRGRHPNKSKTDELVRQGKKINLSLSEMTNFFRQLAKLIKQKKFNPGRPIPGCRTYFLGKFLKNTLMHAQTYLFAAIRPELQYQSFTESTLEFASNASVVKLRPRRMDSHQVTGHDSHKDPEAHDVVGLLASENKPAMLHEKLNILHDVIAGRRPLSADSERQLCHVVDVASEYLPEATSLALKNMITSTPRPRAAALMQVLRLAIVSEMTPPPDGGGGSWKQKDGAATASAAAIATTTTTATAASLTPSALLRDVSKASASLLQESITLEDRAAAIQQVESHMKARAETESKAYDVAIRRGSKAQVHRAGSELFGMDHRSTSIAHAIMLCSGESALRRVMAKREAAPTDEDDAEFEEIALSGHAMSRLAMSLLLDVAAARKLSASSTASTDALEAELRRADALESEMETLKTRVAAQNALIRDARAVAETRETRAQEQAREASEALSEAQASLSAKEDELDALRGAMKTKDAALLAKAAVIAHLDHDIEGDKDHLREAAERKAALEARLAASSRDKQQLVAEHQAQLEASDRTQRQLVAEKDALVALGKTADAKRAEELARLRTALQESRAAGKERLAQAAQELEAMRRDARAEADELHAQIEQGKQKIAALAGRTWLNTAKAGKAVRGKTDELAEAHRAREAVNAEMDTLATMHARSLRLEREKSAALERQVTEAKREWNEAVHAREDAEASFSEAQSQARTRASAAEHECKALQFKLEETVAEHERQLALEHMKRTALESDRDRAEASLQDTGKQLDKCHEDLRVERSRATDMEHRGHMSVSQAETRAMTAEQAKTSCERRLAHAEAELDKSKAKLHEAQAEIEALRDGARGTQQSAADLADLANLRASAEAEESNIKQLKDELEAERRACAAGSAALRDAELKARQSAHHASAVEQMLASTTSKLRAAELRHAEEAAMLKEQTAREEALRSESAQQRQDASERAEKEHTALISKLQADLRQERESTRSQRAAANTDKLQALDQRHAIEQEVQALRMQLADKDRDAASVQRSRDHAEQDAQGVRDSLEREQARAHELELALAAAAAQQRECARQHKVEKADWAEEKSGVRRELDAAQRSASSCKVDLDRERGLRSEDRQREDALHEQVHALEDEARAHAAKLASSRQALKNADMLRDALEKQLAAAQASAQASTKDVRAQLQRGADAVALLQERDARLGSLEAACKAAQKEVKRLTNAASTKKAASLRRQLKEARAAAEDAQSHAASALEVANAHRETLEHHRDGHAEAKTQAGKHKQSASVAKKAMLALKKKLATAQEKVRALETEHAAIIRDHVEHTERLQAKAAASRNKLLSYQKEVASTRAALRGDERWQGSEELKQQVAELREERGVLKAELADGRAQSSEVAAAHAALCAQYEHEIAELRARLARELDAQRACENERDAHEARAAEAAAQLKRAAAAGSVELRAVESERDRVSRALHDAVSARARDVQAMLRASTRMLAALARRQGGGGGGGGGGARGGGGGGGGGGGRSGDDKDEERPETEKDDIDKKDAAVSAVSAASTSALAAAAATTAATTTTTTTTDANIVSMVAMHAATLSRVRQAAASATDASAALETKCAALTAALDEKTRGAAETQASYLALQRDTAVARELAKDACEQRRQDTLRSDAETAQRKSRLAALEDANKTLTADKDRAEAALDAASRQAARAAADAAAALREAETLSSNAAETYRSDLKRLEATLASANDESARLRKDVRRLEAACQDLVGDRDRCREQLKAGRAELSDANVEAEHLKGKLATSEACAREVSQRLARVETERAAWTSQGDAQEETLRGERETWERSKIAWAHEKTTLEGKCTTLEEAERRHAAAAERLGTRASDARSRAAAAEERCHAAESRAAVATLKAASLEKKTGVLHAEVKEAHDRNESTRAELDTLRVQAKHDVHDAQTAEASARAAEKEAAEGQRRALDRATRAEMQRVGLAERLAEAQARHAEQSTAANHTNTRLAKDLAEAERIAARLQTQQAEASVGLERAEARIAEMQKEEARSRGARASATGKLEQDLANAERVAARLKTNQTACEKRLAAAKADGTKAQQEAQRLRDANTLLEDARTHAQGEADRLRNDLRRAAEASEANEALHGKRLASANADAAAARAKIAAVASASAGRESLFKTEMESVVAELARVREQRTARVQALEGALQETKAQHAAAQAQSDEHANGVLELTLQMERAVRERDNETRRRADADAEVVRLQAALQHEVDEREGKLVVVRAHERDMKIQLGRQDGELQAARAEVRTLSEQLGTAAAARAVAENTHAETKERLDRFRESYQVAQSYLIAANAQIEEGKAAFAAEKAERRRHGQAHADDAQRLRQTLLQREHRIEALEGQMRKEALAAQSRHDLSQHVDDLKGELNDSQEQRLLVERALTLFGRNEMACLREVRRCQQLLDQLQRAHAYARRRRRRRRRRRMGAQSRERLQRDREIMESALATTEKVLINAGAYVDDEDEDEDDLKAEDEDALVTPRSRRDHHLHHHDPHYAAAEGQRHCAVCDEIRKNKGKALPQRSRKIPPFQEKGSGLGGGARRGRVSSSPASPRTPQRRRKAAWATLSAPGDSGGGGGAAAAAAVARGGGRNVLSPSVKSVTQSQHITVELSAAIKLLEQTLVQWAEEEEEEEEKSRQGGKGKGKGNRRR